MRHLGIDLGTTHCSVAYSEGHTVRDFAIDQATGPGLNDRLDQLPSCLHLCREAQDEPYGFVANTGYAGAYALEQAMQSPQRSVLSAKSWVSLGDARSQDARLPVHPNADMRISAVDAQTHYLRHILHSFEARVGPVDGEVVITVPASFSMAARKLTLKSAHAAKIPNAVLVEEPLAAFSCWLHKSPSQASKVDSVLVVDMGGGTTDFSLLKRSEEGVFERKAVGEHLLLGGDNLDLALATLARESCETRLQASQQAELLQKVRLFKEALFDQRKPSGRFSLQGASSRLFQNALELTLDPQQAQSVILDGFFPTIENPETIPHSPERSGVLSGGLPYAREAEVTRHLGRFLRNHQMNQLDAILFHGGSLLATEIQDQIMRSLSQWFPEPPMVLKNPDPRLGVSHGACLHALGRRGLITLIGAGLSRNYFLGLESKSGSKTEWLCIADSRQKEGERRILERDLYLRGRRRVRFELASLPAHIQSQIGQVAPEKPVSQGSLNTRVATQDSELKVRLFSELLPTTELRVGLQSVKNPQETHDLVFELSGSASQASMLELAGVEQTLERAFGKPRDPMKPRELQGLIKSLETSLERSKALWPAEVCRYIALRLADLRRGARRSVLHEQVYQTLFGYCMRPGFGFEGDAECLHQADVRAYCEHPSQAQNRINQWILLRRISGGLSPGMQQDLYLAHGGVLLQKKMRVRLPGGHPSENEQLEMLRTFACFEHLHAQDRQELLEQVERKIKRKRLQDSDLWLLPRLATRKMSYADPLQVLPSASAEKTLRLLMGLPAGAQVRKAILHLILPEPDLPERALDESLREQCLQRLKDGSELLEWKDEGLRSGLSLSVGEALPHGLRVG